MLFNLTLEVFLLYVRAQIEIPYVLPTVIVHYRYVPLQNIITITTPKISFMAHKVIDEL